MSGVQEAVSTTVREAEIPMGLGQLPDRSLPALQPVRLAAEPVRKRAVVVLSVSGTGDAVGERAARQAQWLATRGLQVSLYCAAAPASPCPEVAVRVLAADSAHPIARAHHFSEQAVEAMAADLATGDCEWAVIAHEWATIPGLLALDPYNVRSRILALHSLESQRSDLSTELSRDIAALESLGLSNADRILLQDPSTWAHASRLVPDCGPRLSHARHVFPAHEFATGLDPGEVKARYQVGPVDPMLLFVGDMDRRHGPDILIKAMPALLKNHPQARLVFVGDGELLWPVRVQTRYMLLEHAVRVVGHIGDRAVRELIAAADVLVVPSRVTTEDWQILAGWAAQRPVVATHEVGAALCRHEQEAVLVYPNANSCVWGIERVLYDPAAAARIARQGREALERRFGSDSVAAHLEAVAFGTPA